MHISKSEGSISWFLVYWLEGKNVFLYFTLIERSMSKFQLEMKLREHV